MGELTTRRWQRYGKDRLYVSASDGSRVGWVDLPTGAVTLERPGLVAEFESAVVAWQAACGLMEPGAESATAPTPPPAEAAGLPDPAAVASVPRAPEPALSAVQSAAPQHPGAGTTSARQPDESARPDTPPWHDLGANVPGQAARQQADLELAAQRARGRVGSFLARTLDAKTDERAWRVGASGEESIGTRLDRLAKHGWRILHAVPVGEGDSDIDHVLVGPGGVYTLNTKTHPGGAVWVGQHQVRVNGHRTDYLRNSHHEAARAERILTAAAGFPVSVRATLVFLTGTLIPNVTIKQTPDDVLVLDRTDIPGAFKRAPHRLATEQIESIYDHARRSTTWQANRPSPRAR